jgi:dihydrofolate reductase
MYEVMRYWDEDCPDWGAEEHDFAAAWRSQPNWVVSRSLKSVGPNATLVEDDIEAVIRGLKAQPVGEIAVAGPDLAGSLTNLGLIDEYRLYLHPIVGPSCVRRARRPWLDSRWAWRRPVLPT